MRAAGTSKLPGIHILIGAIFFAAGLEAKHHLPGATGYLPIIQAPCAFFSAVFIPLGSLLALRALVFREGSPRQMLIYHLAGVLHGIVMLSLYFFQSMVLQTTLDIVSGVPTILPQLIEHSRNSATEAGRKESAEYAYILYGATIPYRLDSQQIVDYPATPEDRTRWESTQQTDHIVKGSTNVIRRTLVQVPYLFGLYAATYAAALFYGWIWLLVTMPREAESVP